MTISTIRTGIRVAGIERMRENIENAAVIVIADDDPIRWKTNSLCHTGFSNDKWSYSVSRQFRIDTLALTDIERNE